MGEIIFYGLIILVGYSIICGIIEKCTRNATRELKDMLDYLMVHLDAKEPYEAKRKAEMEAEISKARMAKEKRDAWSKKYDKYIWAVIASVLVGVSILAINL